MIEFSDLKDFLLDSISTEQYLLREAMNCGAGNSCGARDAYQRVLDLIEGRLDD